MNILDEIIAHKRAEVAESKEIRPVKLLEKSIFFETDCVSMKQYITRPDKVGIIAEIKRASPSTGTLHEHVDVEQLSIGYMQAGASALSVLSDSKYFSGSLKDVEVARKFNYCPILRKDFVVSEYQIIEAKSSGADCILLIAAALSPQQSKSLAGFARSLGLEVLLEVHNEIEIQDHLNEHLNLVGVNNRDLKTFSTSIENSIRLSSLIPDHFCRISESGIKSAKEVLTLKEVGFQGFLIGGYFMQHAQPERACARLVKEINDHK
ncbi:indole-3-glycerol phosphate synthase TrpC [Cryomorphaceae bacterium]|nr:indole-3-glycerol phosphate synthase TrpC [Cryomorphaceae bacterium]